jgi:hypothetical protein
MPVPTTISADFSDRVTRVFVASVGRRVKVEPPPFPQSDHLDLWMEAPIRRSSMRHTSVARFTSEDESRLSDDKAIARTARRMAVRVLRDARSFPVGFQLECSMPVKMIDGVPHTLGHGPDGVRAWGPMRKHEYQVA